MPPRSHSRSRPRHDALRRANRRVAADYPGETGDRQPVHTVYAGAHLFRADIAARFGREALAALDEYAAEGTALAAALGLDVDPAFARSLRARVVEKLQREPVEDFRIDFEDGYGNRPDAEEDGHARSVAMEVAAGEAAGTLPPFIGIRIKPLSSELHRRSLRTLDLFVSTLVRANRGRLPPNFFVTVPKLMAPEHVSAVAHECTALERRLKLRAGELKLELMIETPQSIFGPDGSSPLRALVAAGRGRVTGAHFGTYDYTALCGITAAWQHLGHPACDFARHMMQVALAQSGVRLSDGATNILPLAPHAIAPGRALSNAERRENRDAVSRAWKRHFDDVTHSLVNGYFQGWDLHPAQLPTRYAALYAFFQSARPAATARLRQFLDHAERATLAGGVFDDAATGQALLNFFARGLSSGALTEREAAETGLTAEDFASRSFVAVLRARQAQGKR